MPGSNEAEPSGGRRFSLVRTLGEGSFGSVYLAEMEGAGGFRRRVALKLLNDEWGAGSDAARRLRDEARLLGRLDHRHIVRVDDLVRLNGRWAVVMEYVSGADMERVFTWAEEAGKRMPPRAAVELGIAVATALDAAWNTPGEDDEPLRVVHRDIKPSNVRLSENGEVKVLDFGVARAAFSGREARTERVRYGSLGYMAPERLLGEPDTAAGDVYALGVLLYELLTTKLFGRAELGVDRQAVQVAAARDELVAVLGEVPLVTLLQRALAYAPEERPGARELAEALRECLPTLPGEDLVRFAREVLPLVAATPVGEGVRGTVLEESGSNTEGAARVSSATLVVEVPGTTSVLDAPAAGLGPPPMRRAPWAAVVVGVVALVGIGAAIASWPGGEEAPAVTGASAGATGVEARTDAPVTSAEGVPGAAPAAGAGTAPAAVGGSTPGGDDASGGATTLPDAALDPTGAATTLPGTPAGPGATGAPNGPRKRVATAPSAVAPSAATVATPEPPAPAPPAPRLRAAKFTLAGAEGITATCGDVTGTGATSTLLRDFPAGECVVVVAGRTTRVRLDTPRGVACTVEGDSLTCR